MRLDLNEELQRNGAAPARARLDTAEPYEPGRANGHGANSNLGGFIFDSDEYIRPQKYVIKDLCPREGTGLAGGKSGAGKSFVMVDLAVAIASGGQFFGRQVREALGVVYLAAEGGGGIRNRIYAAKRKRELTALLPITFSTSEINNLSNSDELDQLISKLKQIDRYFLDQFKVPIGLVIIDTISVAFELKDENSNAEVARCCKQLQKISNELKALALGVHHYGKAGADSDLRGASAWRANVDVVLGVLGDRDNKTGKVTGRSLILAKNRDGEEGAISDFDLRFIELGTDDYGDPFGACAVEPTGMPARERPRKPNVAHDTFRVAFNEVVLTSAVKHFPMGDGPQVSAVWLKSVRDEFYRRYVTGDEDPKTAADKRRSAFNRALNQLISARLYYTEVRDSIEWIWSK